MPGISLVSLGFFVLFALFFAVYWLVRANAPQKWLLLGASYAFYAAIDWRFCLILLTVSLVTYELGRRLGSATAPRTRRILLASGELSTRPRKSMSRVDRPSDESQALSMIAPLMGLVRPDRHFL